MWKRTLSQIPKEEHGDKNYKGRHGRKNHEDKMYKNVHKDVIETKTKTDLHGDKDVTNQNMETYM